MRNQSRRTQKDARRVIIVGRLHLWGDKGFINEFDRFH